MAWQVFLPPPSWWRSPTRSSSSGGARSPSTTSRQRPIGCGGKERDRVRASAYCREGRHGRSLDPSANPEVWPGSTCRKPLDARPFKRAPGLPATVHDLPIWASTCTIVPGVDRPALAFIGICSPRCSPSALALAAGLSVRAGPCRRRLGILRSAIALRGSSSGTSVQGRDRPLRLASARRAVAVAQVADIMLTITR